MNYRQLKALARDHLELPHIHASGHASGPELKAFVREVGPGVLFPVHTEHPELFKGLAKQVLSHIELKSVYEI